MRTDRLLLVPYGVEITLEHMRDGFTILRYPLGSKPEWLTPVTRPRQVRVPSKYPDTFHPRRYVCRECKRPIHGRGLVSNGFRGGAVGARVHERCAGNFTPGYRSTFVSYG